VDASSVAAVDPAAPRRTLRSGHSPGCVHSVRGFYRVGLVAGERRGGAHWKASSVVDRPRSSGSGPATGSRPSASSTKDATKPGRKAGRWWTCCGAGSRYSRVRSVIGQDW
jgi:hypothetical protein